MGTLEKLPVTKYTYALFKDFRERKGLAEALHKHPLPAEGEETDEVDEDELADAVVGI